MRIEDGKGAGHFAGVNNNNRLLTQSISASYDFFVSTDDAETYSWNSTYSPASGDEVIYIKNTHTTKNLHLDIVRLGAANTAVWTVFRVGSGTAAGTTITGTNYNLSSSNTARVTSLGNASVTGSLSGAVLAYARNAATNFVLLDFLGALILGQNDAIAITYTGTSGVAEVTVRGYFL